MTMAALQQDSPVFATKPPQIPATIMLVSREIIRRKNIGAATWTGRQQAFAMMATKCTLAQADCLRQLRETRAYEAYGLTWDEFCKQHAGLARSQADP